MKTLSLVIALAAAAVSVPASAITNFANFTGTSSNPNISYTGNVNGTGSVTSVAPTMFNFLDPLGSTTVASFASNLTLAITTGAGAVFGSLGLAPVTSGSFSFTAPTAVTYNGVTGTNLLSGSFSGGYFTALLGGSTAGYGNSAPPSMVTFTSDFLDFSSSTARDLALAIDAINPRVSAGATGLANFSGNVVGTFGADAVSGSPAAVPEPTSWVLMVAGFGLVGAMTRRRAVRTVTA